MEANNEERGGGGGSKSSFLSRQSSTRWIPTSDQIRILRDLYYNTGLRSPSPEQIQRISARLRQYGKIEGKNVFYWFQNHKARERQKKRLTVDLPSPTSTIATKYCTNNMSPGVPSACSSPDLYGAGLMGTSGGYAGGSVIMEGNFRERFVSGGGDGGDLQAVDNNMGWMGLNTATMPWTSTFHYSPEHQAVHREMETLPLFPIHSQEQQQEEREHDNVSLSQSSARNHIECNWPGKDEQASGYLPAFHWPDGAQKQQNGEEEEADEAEGEEEEDRFYVFNNHPFHHHSDGGGASLELTLNSYYYTPHGSA